MKIFVTNSPITNPEPAPEPVSMTLHLSDGVVPPGWAAQGITGPGVYDLPDPAPPAAEPSE
jgi:hypothetical protein